ncbi:transposable element Tc1 transposase [Trichonephila clavipes]|nr:transposable element Tc1 transposase [Trichonephila clavipes]
MKELASWPGVARAFSFPSVEILGIWLAKRASILYPKRRTTGTHQFLPILGRFHPLESFICKCPIRRGKYKHINSLQSSNDAIHWSPSTIRELGHLVAPTGGEQVADACCRVRSTTPAEDRYIVLSAKRNRRTTAQQVANQFLAASGKQISRKTVARRLRGGGLYARRPVVCVPLTRQHRTARLQWCREHHNWTEQDWACVLFSDESRFSLSSDCRRQLIWRKSGTAYRSENIQEKDRYPTCSIMVWAGIMINGRTRLHVVANGTMTGQRYIDEVLLPHVRLFLGAVGDKFVFMDDNATCHRTLAVQDCLDSEGIQRLVWPARSQDLNPIENVWDALGRQVAGRNYPPTNKNTLIRALTEEWDKLPQQLLDNVVQSMVRRVECCITLHGGHIPY